MLVIGYEIATLYGNFMQARNPIDFYGLSLIRFHAFVALLISFYVAILSRPIREISRIEKRHGWLRRKMMVIALCALLWFPYYPPFLRENASIKCVQLRFSDTS